MISGLHFFGIRVSEDNFYQIVLGRYIAAHGLPHELPFTVHAAEHLHYMVQQWLFAVLDAEIFDHFSWAGLVIFGYVAAIALVFAVYRMLLLVSGGRHIAALPAAFAFGCLPIMRFSFTFCRPYYLSCLLMVLEVILLERYRRRYYRHYHQWYHRYLRLPDYHRQRLCRRNPDNQWHYQHRQYHHR